MSESQSSRPWRVADPCMAIRYGEREKEQKPHECPSCGRKFRNMAARDMHAAEHGVNTDAD